MTSVVVSGATGLVGRFVAEALLRGGHHVRAMGRTAPPARFFSRPVTWVAGDLAPASDHSSAFGGADWFVHCAFQHLPGRYRGGEGDDPAGFVGANVDGTLALMRTARRAGVGRVVLLSTRAVYGPQLAGTALTETAPCNPDTLYGRTKLAVERALAAMASETFLPVIARATGVYGPAGPGRLHKWSELFAAFASGQPIAPRAGTEVHGDDLAAAIVLLLQTPVGDLVPFGPAPVFNVSDLLIDRRDLLAAYGRATGVDQPWPARADTEKFNVMDCSRLRSLGWNPRGRLDLAGLF